MANDNERASVVLLRARASIEGPAPTKTKTLDKVVRAAKSVLGNPVVQSALAALLSKALTKKR